MAKKHRLCSTRRLTNGLAATLAITVASLCAPSAKAASDTWIGATDGIWATTTNWLGSSVPGAGETATLNAASSNTTIDLGAGVTLGTLLFDTSSAAAYTIGSGAVGSQTLTLGTLAGGVQMNSTVAQNQHINANLALSTTGTYTIGLTNNSTTNTLTVAGNISASTAGIKILTVTGSGNTTLSGAITSGTGTIGLSKSGSGTLTLSNAGTSTIASNFQMAGGLVQITAGTINVTENSGNNTGLRNGGNLTMSGGTLNLSGNNSWFPIGDTNGQTSTLTVSGGTVNITNSWGSEVGRAGAGVLTITGGTYRNADTGNIGFILGDTATGSGTVNLNGGTLTVNKVVQGTSSGNKFYFNGGTLSTTGANTTAFFAATTRIDTEVRNGGGTIDTAGFNATIADDIVHSTVGGDNAIDGGITKTGVGILTLSGANTYTGATTVNAGTLAAGSTTAFSSSSAFTLANSSGVTLNLNSNANTIGSLAGGGATGGNVTLGSATLTTGGNNTSTSFAGVISGTGGLTKAGSGTQTFTGANTYTGATTISGGTLLVNGTHSAGAGVYNVNTGTLGGSGAITSTGAVTIGSAGQLSAGSAPNTVGTLTFDGSGGLDISSAVASETGEFIFNLDTVAASDKISLTSGTLTIGTGLNFADFAFTTTANVLDGNVYTLFSSTTAISGSLDSTVANLTGSLGGGLFGTISISGNNIDLTVVPEPSTWAMLLGGLGMLIGFKRPRRPSFNS